MTPLNERPWLIPWYDDTISLGMIFPFLLLMLFGRGDFGSGDFGSGLLWGEGCVFVLPS